VSAFGGDAWDEVLGGRYRCHLRQRTDLVATGRLTPSRRFRPLPPRRSSAKLRPKPDLHDLASGWSDRLKPAIRIGLTPLRQSPAQSVRRAAPSPFGGRRCRSLR
jgi:hypothetical protein